MKEYFVRSQVITFNKFVKFYKIFSVDLIIVSSNIYIYVVRVYINLCLCVCVFVSVLLEKENKITEVNKHRKYDIYCTVTSISIVNVYEKNFTEY